MTSNDEHIYMYVLKHFKYMYPQLNETVVMSNFIHWLALLYLSCDLRKQPFGQNINGGKVDKWCHMRYENNITSLIFIQFVITLMDFNA